MDKINSLEDQITKFFDDTAAVKDEITEVRKVSEIREQENKEFQEKVMDQMQHILQEVIACMWTVYKQQALVQWNKHKQSSGVPPVIGMMEQIVEDFTVFEKELIAVEQEAQASYESFADDSNAPTNMLNTSIKEKTKLKVAAEAQRKQITSEKDSIADRFEDFQTYDADLHAKRDYVMGELRHPAEGAAGGDRGPGQC
eukprot:5529084-Heterocapsa_arctica.AAC.1